MRRSVGLVLAALALVGAVIELVLRFTTDLLDDVVLGLFLPSLVTPLVGGVILWKRPENRIGLLLVVMSILGTMTSLLSSMPERAIAAGELLQAAAWQTAGNITFVALFVSVFVLGPLWFPTGRPFTPRWAWVSWTALGTGGLALVTALLADQVCVSFPEQTSGCLLWGPNPVGLALLPPTTVDLIFLVGLGIAAIGAATSLVVRYRRSSLEQRLQIRWFMLAVIYIVIAFTLSLDLTLGQLLPSATIEWVLAIGFTALPVSIGLAVLKYRLYEIDRIISRTVGYALVVAALAGLYGLIVVGVPMLLPAVEESQLLVAAATLVAFFLFNPLRKRILQAVDRRFYRSRYDAERVVAEFAARLRDEVDLDELTADWVEVVSETVQPESMSVWVRSES